MDKVTLLHFPTGQIMIGVAANEDNDTLELHDPYLLVLQPNNVGFDVNFMRLFGLANGRPAFVNLRAVAYTVPATSLDQQILDGYRQKRTGIAIAKGMPQKFNN